MSEEQSQQSSGIIRQFCPLHDIAAIICQCSRIERRMFSTSNDQDACTQIHNNEMMKSLKRFKDRGTACDFEFRVGQVSFPLHRIVFMANSTFFDVHWETDDGYIAVNELTEGGVRECIEFFYSGEISTRVPGEIQNILAAAHRLHIGKLKKLCIRYLRQDLTVRSCLTTSRLFHLCGSERDQSLADDYVVSNFDEVIKLDQITEISRVELQRFLSRPGNTTAKVAWDAVAKWARAKEIERLPDLPDVLKIVLRKKLITLDLLLSIWKNSDVQKSENAKVILMKAMIQEVNVSTRNLDLDLCFELKNATRSHTSADSENFSRILSNCLAVNLPAVVGKTEFLRLPYPEFLDILLNDKLDCPDESMRWEIIKDWVSYDRLVRITNLPDLVRTINFKNLSAEYILRNIRHHGLLSQSLESLQVLEQDAPITTGNDAVVMLDCGSGSLVALDPQTGNKSTLKSLEKKGFLKIFSLRGELYLVQDRDLLKYCKGNFQKLNSLQRAPNKNAQVATMNDRAFLVEKRRMSYFSPTENAWTEGLQGCALGGGFCTAATNESLFAVGGWETYCLAKLYNQPSDCWVRIADLKFGRRGSAAVVHGNRLYILGGSAPITNKTAVESYDEDANEWKEEIHLIEPSAWHAAVEHNDNILLFGGYPNRKSMQLYNRSSRLASKKEILDPVGMVQVCVCNLWTT